MKRSLLILATLAIAGSLIWTFAQPPSGARPIATLIPAGPVLYLEAKNFQALLKDWDGSKEKQAWLASANYSVFSNSNLFQKLQRAQDEFAAAAGLPPNMAMLSNAAGGESAIAIYDIGKLQFLYVTRMPAAQFSTSDLWKTRGKYEPRKSSGLDYYVKIDRPTERVAAFAVAQDYLFLATREDVLAGALSLLASQNVPAMAAEPWYTQSIQAAKAPGELRLVLNMPNLMLSPYMRSYWIQRNASELKLYSSAISDASRAGGQITEQRVLLRVNQETPSWNENAVAQLIRLVPTDAGVYRAWASPSVDQTLDLIREKILGPAPSDPNAEQRAPAAASMDSTTGTESDLETRIDQAPLQGESREIPQETRALFSSARLEAAMSLGRSRVLPEGVLVAIDNGVVLLRSANWDPALARTALTAAGVQLDGPSPAGLIVNGPLLIVANRPEFAQSIAANLSKPAGGTPARYAAIYRHKRELPNFARLTQLLDTPLRAGGDTPMFFSQNLTSLGQSILGRLDTAAVSVHDSGAAVSQNLVYTLQP